MLVFLLFALLGLQLVAVALPPDASPSPETTQLWLGRLAIMVIGLQFGLWMNTAINTWVGERERGRGTGGIVANPVVLSMLAWLARILVWATVLLLILGNMGVNITAFVASLGIGGVAVALGLQNILKDLFASLAIGLDKPFVIGEYIQADDFQGTVIHVGVKTTRIRSLSGEEICIGNANLLDKTIRNYARMATRRIVFNFSIPLDTSRERVQQVVDILHDILARIDDIQVDRAHFKGFGASSLDFEAVYIVQQPGYGVYMDIQQRVNLELMERLEALDVRFAVPVQTLRVARPGKAATRAVTQQSPRNLTAPRRRRRRSHGTDNPHPRAQAGAVSSTRRFHEYRNATAMGYGLRPNPTRRRNHPPPIRRAHAPAAHRRRSHARRGRRPVSSARTAVPPATARARCGTPATAWRRDRAPRNPPPVPAPAGRRGRPAPARAPRPASPGTTPAARSAHGP
jgi:small-conductance mechanosensitive channel